MINTIDLKNVFVKFTFLIALVLLPKISLGQEGKKAKKEKSFFTIEDDKKDIKEYSTEEIRRELDEKEGLLKIKTRVPKWKFSKDYSSETLKGKVYVLDFWGSWCAPCIKAMPKIEKLHQYYKNQKDIVIIGVSARESNPNAAKIYFNKMPYNYIHIQNGDEIADAFKVNSFPAVYIINKEGLIIDAFFGFHDEDFERVKKIIDKNL
jgi:thiol-disulfide isomerase/thioredoxin